MPRFTLGTRGSPLALVQANLVRDALAAAHGWAVDEIAIAVVRTTGDRVQDRPLAEIGGKALWTKELDRALLAGEVDACVHSMKDVETVRPEAIMLAATLPRADTRDRLIGAASIAALRHGATVGTSSPRRRAQLLARRPDLHVVTFRGNVDTRLAKLARGEADATLLAAAGLERLGRHDVGTALDLLPAPAQGAVGVEVRADDLAILLSVNAISDVWTSYCVHAERSLLAALRADCHSPVAALAQEDEHGGLRLDAELLSEDGSAHVAGSMTGELDEPLGERLAADLLARAPEAIRALFAG